jgi:hypothetical protein
VDVWRLVFNYFRNRYILFSLFNRGFLYKFLRKGFWLGGIKNYKNMKKFFLVFTAIMTVTIVIAQKKSSNPTVFSIGAEASVPIGEFHSLAGYNFGFGGSAQVAHKIASNLSLTVYAGYLNYANQNSTTNNYHFTVIPVLAGAKFWIAPKVYAQGQLGVAFNSTKKSNDNINYNKSTGFAYSPGVGFVIANNIDFVIKYFGNSTPGTSTSAGGTLSSFGARLAYNFLKR